MLGPPRAVTDYGPREKPAAETGRWGSALGGRAWRWWSLAGGKSRAENRGENPGENKDNCNAVVTPHISAVDRLNVLYCHKNIGV